jgi:hypothetical protein
MGGTKDECFKEWLLKRVPIKNIRPIIKERVSLINPIF